MKDHVIYIRTSTEEQNPENQVEKILTLLGQNVIENNEYEILQDKQSAWKDTDRENFTAIQQNVKRNLTDIYIWDLDRLYRNRKKLVAFMALCKAYKVKVHSYRQKWLEDLNKAPSPWNEIMSDLMLQIMGWMAEEESEKKSERIKAAVKRKKSGTYSYKGNKWGRKALPKQTRDKVLLLHKEGKSIRKIAATVMTTDKNKNMKSISKSAVHKIISDFSGDFGSI